MTEMMSLIVISVLAGNAITWAFPLSKWVKEKLGIDDQAMFEGDPSRFKRLLHKAASCDACCSFWATIAIGLPTVGLVALMAAPLAFTLAAILYRVLNNA